MGGGTPSLVAYVALAFFSWIYISRGISEAFWFYGFIFISIVLYDISYDLIKKLEEIKQVLEKRQQ